MSAEAAHGVIIPINYIGRRARAQEVVHGLEVLLDLLIFSATVDSFVFSATETCLWRSWKCYI